MSGAPLFTLVIFMKVNNIYNIVDVCVEFCCADACVEFCFLKK